VLAGVEPAAFWRRFEELTTIARPSRREEPVIAWVKEWAAERGFALRQDAGRNLVIRVPATAGREATPTLVLQGHLDMVCERSPESPKSGGGADRALEGRRLADGGWDDVGSR
jgi:dipeptidase D